MDYRPVNLPLPVTEDDDDSAMYAKLGAWEEAQIAHGDHYQARANCELCRECGPAEPFDWDHLSDDL